MDNVPNVYASRGARLPLRSAPLIFGLRNSDKTIENLWGVGGAEGRYAYVYCSSHRPEDPQWHDLMERSARTAGYNEVSLSPPPVDAPVAWPAPMAKLAGASGL